MLFGNNGHKGHPEWLPDYMDRVGFGSLDELENEIAAHSGTSVTDKGKGGVGNFAIKGVGEQGGKGPKGDLVNGGRAFV